VLPFFLLLNVFDVEGASGGLGEALAEELYKAGAQLILCARRLDELNKVKENLLNVSPFQLRSLKLNRTFKLTAFSIKTFDEISISTGPHIKFIFIYFECF
jgi:NADP-dependent 3-hydroxy acid dehydrogenase YdfG